MKVGRKRRFLSFPFPVPIPQKERKKRRKKKEKEEKKEEKWKKICEFTRLWKTKRPCLSFDRQGLKLCGFNLGKRQTFLPRKKQFGFAETTFVLANFFDPPKGKFLYPFLLPFPLPKTERKKDQKKEKIKKKGTKKRENFLRIFPVDPPIFLSQKEEKREEITKFSFSISYF